MSRPSPNHLQKRLSGLTGRTNVLAGIVSALPPCLLFADVVPYEALLQHKETMRLNVEQTGPNLMTLSWESLPNVYYYAEGTNQLSHPTDWTTAKLLTDLDPNDGLMLSTQMSGDKAFYRLDLHTTASPRIYQDSNHDQIIDKATADAGLDAFAAPDPTDSDNDSIPDYFEQFHFGTLEHDGNYVAIVGGLTLAQSFATGTDPKVLDSDNDGMSDADELAAGTDPNYNQTRNDPDDDADKDGLTNDEENTRYGTLPLNPDTDGDGATDGADGWPHDANLSPERSGETYVLVDLSAQLPIPTGQGANRSASVQVDDHGGVLLALNEVDGQQITYTTSYYNWATTSQPEKFNGRFERGSDQISNSTLDHYGVYAVNLTRSGLLHFAGKSRTFADFFLRSVFLTEDRAFLDQYDVVYDAVNQTAATELGLADGLEQIVNLNTFHSEETVTPAREYGLIPYAQMRGGGARFNARYLDSWGSDANALQGALLQRRDWVDEVVQHPTYHYRGNAYMEILDSGKHGGQLTRVYPNLDETYDIPLLSNVPYAYPGDVSTVRWPNAQGSVTVADGVFSALGQDILVDREDTEGTAIPHRYSLDGSHFYDFRVWYPQRGVLNSAMIGKSSDELVMLAGPSSVLINQSEQPIESLLSNAEGWSDFSLQDINSHGMIVGSAKRDGKERVIALLNVALDPVFGDGASGSGYCPSGIGNGSDSLCTFADMDVHDLDPAGSLNQLTNPAAIVIESNSNDGNVAIFELKVDDLSDEQAEQIFHWEIASEGGSAVFYPSASDNKGKTIKVRGIAAGRVRLNVRTSPSLDTEPAIFTEAEVVVKKTLPYRMNILTYEGNDDDDLPNAFTDIPNVVKAANTVLRQAGIELVQSTDLAIGNTKHVKGGLEDSINNIGNAFYVQADDQNQVEDVGGLEAIEALSMNYRPNVMQINWFEDFNNSGTGGESLYRPASTHSGRTLSAAYKTSINDKDDESIAHTLNFFGKTENAAYPGLYGLVVAWNIDDPVWSVGGRLIAHEVLHTLNLEHRRGIVTVGDDGLEPKYRGPDGTNIMDYGGGLDIDLLQALIARGSPLLK